jgi:hypothetical protein|tara:strand:+ start:1910 stop:2437 length:528 start_codon:yes stop_codon:yes gene_type:complete
MDFNALQHKLFAMDPVDPREDIAKMKAQAQAAAPAVASENIDYITESVNVPHGSLEMDRDYSVTDFAALAGVTINESQRTGSAGQAKANEPMPKAEPGRTRHPLKDKLVGECSDDTMRIEELEDRIRSLEAVVIKLAAKAGLVESTPSKKVEKFENIDSIKDSLYAALNKRMGVQ